MEGPKGVIVLGGFIQALALVRSLAELHIPVYIAEENNCIAQYSRFCTKFLRSPKAESPELAEFLIDVAKKYGLKGWLLLPTDDHLVENLSKSKAPLQEYYRMFVPSQDDLYRIINKKKLLEIAEQCGTNIPETCYVDSMERAKEFRFPLLVKGNYGRSFYQAMHTKAFKVDSFSELQTVVDSLAGSVDAADVMIQELIPSRRNDHVVSCTCFAEEGDIKSYWMGQKLRERPIENGTATFAESILVKEILEQSIPLMKALKYTGVCEIEFIFDHRDEKWKLIEINPRTWKWVGLAKACGIDYAKMLYLHAMDTAQSFPASYRTGVKWVDHFTDPIISMKMILTHRMTIADYVRSMKGTVIPAIWNWKDPLPALYFPFYSVHCKARRLWKACLR